MPKLFLRVLSDATLLEDGEGYDIRVAWMVTENDGEVRGLGVTDQRGLADVADPNVDWLKDPDNTVVFVPSHFILKVACEVPGRSTMQIRRALPFAVEEYVATDIESMHIAHAGIRAGTPVQCNIIAREQIENWLACFASAGVKVGHMIAESELLPTDERCACLLFEEGQVLVAHQDQAAVIDRDTLGFALGGLDIDRVVALGDTPTDLELSHSESKLTVDAVTFDESGLLGYLADRFRLMLPHINLLQGEYQAERVKSAHSARWQAVGALAAVWVLVAFVGMIVQGWWAESEAERLEAESFAFYQSLFPRESQPVSVDQLRRRMASKLGQTAVGGERSAFIGLMGEMAQVLSAADSVTSVSYAEQRRELNMEVMLSNYDQIDSLKERLAANGVIMDTTNAEQEGTKVRSRIRVRYAES